MIVRVQKRREHPYVVLERDTLRMTSLSFKARGLWALCMTYPDDWEFQFEHLAAQSDVDGIYAVRAAFKELEAVGLARLERLRNDGGAFVGSRWVIYETQRLNPQQRPPFHRDDGFSILGENPFSVFYREWSNHTLRINENRIMY